MKDDRLALLCPMSPGAPAIERVRLPSCTALPLDALGPVDVHVVLRGTAQWDRRALGAGDVMIVRGAADPCRAAGADPGAESLRARFAVDRFVMPPSQMGATFVHLSAVTVAADRRLAALVALVMDEGDSVLARRAFEVLFVAIERHRLANGDSASRSTQPLPISDARIARTIAELHARYAERWTVASMAKHAGMSRAAFARRFTDLTRATPHAYLARLRLEMARVLLREGDASIAEVAVRVGYRAESVFSRAFKRMVGEPPAVFRRRSRIMAIAA